MDPKEHVNPVGNSCKVLKSYSVLRYLARYLESHMRSNPINSKLGILLCMYPDTMPGIPL